MKLSRNFYCNLDNARLNTVNKFLGHEFNHHDALADAIACGNILLEISEELNTKDINAISNLVGVSLGSVNENGYNPSSTKGRVLIRSNRQALKQNKRMAENLNFNTFENEVVVFTGGLSSMTRDEAITLVRKLSGIVGSSVTKKTTCLVTNAKDIEDLQREEMSNKLKKTMDLKKMGQSIKVLNEETFLKLCFH
jgi:DNA polymerase-3 subunit epsilon